MLVLFSIAMVCFFALFGMMVVLLRQAKAEGFQERLRKMGERASQRSRRSAHTSDTHAPFGVSQTGLDLTLSNLVPSKQPDWRFMVREGSRDLKGDDFGSRSTLLGGKSPRPFHYGRNRPDHEYFNKDLGDLTDPQSSQSRIARRA